MLKNFILDDMVRSGLTERNKIILKIKQEPLRSLNLLVPNLGVEAAYRIPYYTPEKKPFNFFRLKLFYSDDPTHNPSGQIRYWQPAGTPPHVYFPLLYDWQSIAQDTSKEILITEGEKKAAKACREGLPCIGLGGVWSFQSKLRQTALIEDFNFINWKNRPVSIVYDNDVAIKKDVRMAQSRLSENLTEMGALVSIVLLPQSSEKIGLDDYLVNHSVKQFKNLERIPFGYGHELCRLNSEVSFIRHTGTFFYNDSKSQINLNRLLTTFSTRNYHTIKNEKLVKKSVIKKWVDWPQRQEFRKLIYAPGQPQVVKGDLNIWPGWGAAPKKGSVAPFKNLINHMFGDDVEFKKWFYQWLAYPLVHPGTKLYQAAVLWSLGTGTGKTFVGVIMSYIYGENFSLICQKDLHSGHNVWAKHKQFALGDEITGSDKRKDADNIKSIITRDRISINDKYVPIYVIIDCINYLFTSNHPDAFAVERFDRRLGIKEVNNQKVPETLVKEINAWLKNGGASYLFYYLKNNISLKTFNPSAPAVATQSKNTMCQLSLSDIDSFCGLLKLDPTSVLVFDNVQIDRDNFTIDDLVRFYDPDKIKRTTNIAMSKALSRTGFKMHTVRCRDGVKKLWALRNLEKWASAAHHEFVADYDKSVLMLAKAKKKYRG